VIVTRCGHGMDGCHEPTPDERLQAYVARLSGRYDAHSHARRAAAGLDVIKRLRALWKRRKPKKAPRANPRTTQTTVVPFKRRA
jgi:hypothetical protein